MEQTGEASPITSPIISPQASFLYQQEAYPVILGQQTVWALCTCWSDTQSLLKAYPSISQYFRITSTLYSIEGVSVLLRNLCLCPDIQYLFLWPSSPLSKTTIGKAGWTALQSLWSNGISDANDIIGTPHAIHQEMDHLVIRGLIKDVKLVDASQYSIPQLLQLIAQGHFPARQIERKASSFPSPQRNTSSPMPSEEVGWLVRQQTIVQAWLSVIDRILRYGKIKSSTSSKISTPPACRQKELYGVQWIIENEDPTHPYLPDWPLPIREKIGLIKTALDEYTAHFLDPSLPDNTAYTYGERLRAYHTRIDQVDAIIQKIRDNRSTRRAVAITLSPILDAESISPPCLNHVQILADDRIHLFAVFRSHDIFKSGISNAFGLLGLQQCISEKTGLPRGRLSIMSNSAHLYEEDWAIAEEVVQSKFRTCIQPRFDESTDIDPRGIVRIRVAGTMIFATLFSLDGRELHAEQGASAKEILLRFAKLNVLSRPDHYGDIAIELVKAELAAKLNIQYIQDRPLHVQDCWI